VTEPLISIIIPAYNAARFIQRAIESVQCQTLDDWELIIINDGSTDQTQSLVDKAVVNDGRIRCIQQVNRGLSHARNAGLGVANGKFIQFLDADDTLLPRKLESSIRCFRHNPGIDIVASMVRVIDSASAATTILSVPDKSEMIKLWERNFLAVNAPLVRSELIHRIGLFETKDSGLYRLYGCEDWHFWLRASIIGAELTFLPEVLVENYRHEHNMSRRDIEMHLSEIWCLDSLQTKCVKNGSNFEAIRQASLLYRVCRGLGTLDGPQYEDMVATFKADELVRSRAALMVLLRSRKYVPDWFFRKLCHGLSKVHFLTLRRAISARLDVEDARQL